MENNNNDVILLAQKLDPIFKQAHDAHMALWDRQNCTNLGPFPELPQIAVGHAFRREEEARKHAVKWWAQNGIKMQFVHPVGYIGPDKNLTTIAPILG